MDEWIPPGTADGAGADARAVSPPLLLLLGRLRATATAAPPQRSITLRRNGDESGRVR